MRRSWIALIVPVLLAAACTDPEPVTSPEPGNTSTSTTTTPATTSTPAPTAGQDFSLSFDGIDDRVLVPWASHFLLTSSPPRHGSDSRNRRHDDRPSSPEARTTTPTT